MEKLTKLFENPSNTIKTMSKILFYACLIIGVCTAFMGFIRVFDAMHEWGVDFFEVLEYSAIDAMTDYEAADGYAAKATLLQGVYTMLVSLTMIPLYGFGCLIGDVATIKKAATKEDN